MSRKLETDEAYPAILAKWEGWGYIKLGDLMEEGRFTLDQLYELGLVKAVDNYNTAMLYDYRLTAKGEELIKFVGRLELFMIKEENLPKLLSMIEHHEFPAKTERWRMKST